MRRKPLLCAAAALLVVQVSSAMAEELDDIYADSVPVEAPSALAEPPHPAPMRAGALEEMVVTAQRREQRLQDVPVAVTALGQDFLEERGLTSVQNLGAYAPNLKVQESPGNTTGAQIAIRGSVTINPALSWEPAVAIYLDGVYYGKTQGSLFEVADLQRIEVLRGPQGTLYGRNTLAGAINLVTAAPSGELGGSLKAGIGNYDQRSLRGSLDLPAFGDFSVKLNGFLSQRDGLIPVADNPYPPINPERPRPTELHALDHYGGRIAVRYAPADTLTLDYAYDISKADDLPRYGQLARVGTLANSPLGPLLAAIPLPGGIPLLSALRSISAPPQGRQDTATIDAESYDIATVKGHALTAAWTPDAITFKSITALREMVHGQSGDFDGTQLTLVPGAAVARYEALSQELQALGSLGAFDVVAGLFLFRETGSSGPPANGYPPVFGVLELDTGFEFETRAWAVYGQGDYHLGERVTFTAGLRYTQEDKWLTHHYRLAGATMVPEGSGGEKTFRNFSPTLIAAWQAADDLNLYAKWSRGYKSGGFNGEATSEESANTPYDPELLDAYEIGAKTSWLDRRLTLNLAAFHNRSRDMQLSRFDGGLTLGSTIVNAGKATIQGVEVEALLQLLEDLQLRLTYGYLDPRYDEFIDNDPSTGEPQDVKDDRAFPLAPRHTAGAGIDWIVWRLRNGALKLSLDADYTDRYYLYPYALDPDAQPSAQHNQGDARTLLNGRISLTELAIGSTTLEAAIWGRNLLDKEYVATTLDLGPQLGGINLNYWGDPRTLGLELGLRW